MDVLKTLQSCMNLLGIQEKDGKYGGWVRLYIAIEGAMFLNIFCFLVYKWDNMDDRIIALKALAFIMTFIAYSWSLIYYWDDFGSMLSLFHEMRFDIPHKVSPQRIETFKEAETDMRRYNDDWYYMIVAYILCTTLVPVTISILRAVVFSGDLRVIIKENSAVPFPLYYPEFTKAFGDLEWLMNLIVYMIGYVTHSAYIIMTGVYAQLVYVTSLAAIVNVEYELKLLALSLREIEDAISEKSRVSVASISGSGDKLEAFLKYIVRHHQETFRKFNVVNKGVRWIAFTLCSAASIYICTSVFTIVQKDQLILKLQEGVFFIVWACGIFLFDYAGERVKTQNENLRSALYECSWFDKPKMFNKSLLIIITRACRPFDIKPFGLYGFNLNSFATTMNAAYCYYNFLTKFKNK